ncbi:uncharacterized protein A4U43_C07F12510 [Asparagus officinalis]|uniref:Trichome birefringence-like C-terminal domain-containing protein n=1 Tax=Asparagus officinalis TaxID=4686 RepID=A0A5P1EBH0_ASPOF|nr:uncharacterized protein A4U43_C07F12510 [Asparagus officinalis]
MERQRSFIIKPTRLFLLSLTVSFSLLFSFLFSSWVFKITPSASSNETNLRSFSGFSAIKAQTFIAFTGNFSVNGRKGSTSRGTHFLQAADSPREALSPRNEWNGELESSEVEEFSDFPSNISVSKSEDPILGGNNFAEAADSTERALGLSDELKDGILGYAQDYQCSVEYYLSHFLVRESKARIGQKRKQTLRIDAIDRSSSRWRGADILVFNSAHWWSHYKTKAGLNYYQEGDYVHSHLDANIAYKRALVTWASWVDKYINPTKTQVFFRSSAPSHFSGGEWNAGGHCRESTQPLNYTHTRNAPEKNLIVEEVVKQMRTPVTVLNITSLSGFRIDGHPSVFGRKPENGKPSRIEDCSHWCLPGVPDTWNELLYFYLLSGKRLISTG